MPWHCCHGAMCVQNFNDSLSCAIRITYRSSQRSSSIHEPRDPPLKVVGFIFFFFRKKRFVRRNELKLYGFFLFLSGDTHTILQGSKKIWYARVFAFKKCEQKEEKKNIKYKQVLNPRNNRRINSVNDAQKRNIKFRTTIKKRRRKRNQI